MHMTDYFTPVQVESITGTYMYRCAVDILISRVEGVESQS